MDGRAWVGPAIFDVRDDGGELKLIVTARYSYGTPYLLSLGKYSSASLIL